MDESLVMRVRNHPLFHSFLLYSAFRAVYGIGILLVAYFFATSTNAPWWATILIFIASMIFAIDANGLSFFKKKKCQQSKNGYSML